MRIWNLTERVGLTDSFILGFHQIVNVFNEFIQLPGFFFGAFHEVPVHVVLGPNLHSVLSVVFQGELDELAEFCSSVFNNLHVRLHYPRRKRGPRSPFPVPLFRAACTGRLADFDFAAVGEIVGHHYTHDRAKDRAASGEFGYFDHRNSPCLAWALLPSPTLPYE